MKEFVIDALDAIVNKILPALWVVAATVLICVCLFYPRPAATSPTSEMQLVSTNIVGNTTVEVYQTNLEHGVMYTTKHFKTSNAAIIEFSTTYIPNNVAKNFK